MSSGVELLPCHSGPLAANPRTEPGAHSRSTYRSTHCVTALVLYTDVLGLAFSTLDDRRKIKSNSISSSERVSRGALTDDDGARRIRP